MVSEPERDFLYENAPLIEVVAEARWELQKIMAPSGVRIDPHFSSFSEDFARLMAENGFGSVERVVPEAVPLELIPHHVVYRYRKRPNQWPCTQIGPGVISANHVPPYQGWEEFRSFLRNILQTLLSAYPVPDRYLKLNLLELRYIDGFKEQHGMLTPSRFIRENLQLQQGFPEALLALSSGGVDDVELSGTFRFPVRDPSGSQGSIQVDVGEVGSEPAVIATLRVRQVDHSDIKLDIEALCDWFDGAHGTVRGMFQSLTSDETKENMGPVTYIGAE